MRLQVINKFIFRILLDDEWQISNLQAFSIFRKVSKFLSSAINLFALLQAQMIVTRVYLKGGSRQFVKYWARSLNETVQSDKKCVKCQTELRLRS